MVIWEIELVAVASMGFYFFRWVFQIWETRKQGQSVAPMGYWVCTVLAGILMAIYTYLLGSVIVPISLIFSTLIWIYNIRIELKRLKKENVKYEKRVI